MANSKIGSKTAYVHKIIGSPVGPLTLVGSDRGLAAILWENDDPKRVPLNIGREEKAHSILVETERQLQEYFAGTRRKFTVPLDFTGTDFQNKVWQALLAIPFGETRSYGEIARALGNPKAMRAVGAANGRNPISIIAPCHRVIGSTGKLTGFAGGLKAKSFLLNLEQDLSAPRSALSSGKEQAVSADDRSAGKKISGSPMVRPRGVEPLLQE